MAAETGADGAVGMTKAENRDKTDFRALRILVVGGKPFMVQTLRTVLTVAGVREIEPAADSARALEMLRQQSFSAIFADEDAEAIEGVKFAIAARRTPGILNPLLPIFLVTGGAHRTLLEKARDDGFTDVITRPVSTATIIRKLRTAIEFPRSFIAAPEFFGPDRRSAARANFNGSDRRKLRPKKVRLPEHVDVSLLSSNEVKI